MINFRQTVAIAAFLVLVVFLFTQVVVTASHAHVAGEVTQPMFLTLLVSLVSSLNPQYRESKAIGTHLMPAVVVAAGVLVYLGIGAAVSGEALAWLQVPAVLFGAALSVLLVYVLRKASR